MDGDLGVIELRDLHAVEESIRYLETNSSPTYEELVKHLSWYFNRDQVTLRFGNNHRPKGWMLDWIIALTN